MRRAKPSQYQVEGIFPNEARVSVVHSHRGQDGTQRNLVCELRGGVLEEYYSDGATVLRVALTVAVVLLVMFFVFQARKHAGTTHK